MNFGHRYRERKCPANDTSNIAIISTRSIGNAEIGMANVKSFILTIRGFMRFDCEAGYYAFKKSTSDDIVQPVLAVIDLCATNHEFFPTICCRKISSITVVFYWDGNRSEEDVML